MAATTVQTGVGVVWGITVSSVTVSATGIGIVTSQTVNNDAKSVENLNSDGDLIGIAFFDFRTKLELEVYPSSSTLNAAKTSLNACPSPGSIVTVGDSVFTRVAGGTTKAYVCTASSVKFSNSDKVVISMSLESAPNMTAAVVTAT
jgi:hypothetical protein